MRNLFSVTRRSLILATGLIAFAGTAAVPASGRRKAKLPLAGISKSTSIFRPSRISGREPRDFASDISLTNNDFQSTALCNAACFAATYAFSTVPYFTLDQPRSLTLSYNGDRAFPRPFVFAKVAPDYGSADVAEYWLEVSVNGSPRTFVNGDTKLIFAGSTSELRLAGQFDAQDLNTNVVPMTITITAKYMDGILKVHTYNTQLMIVNEANSYFGKGWTLAELQRLYYTSANVYMIAEGDGTAVQFPTLGVHAADFSVLTYSGGIYTRTYPDGSKAVFGGTGKLTSLVDLHGRATTFTYDASGRVSEVFDPMSGNSSGAPHYVLAYGSTGISTITETGGPGPSRTTSITIGSNGSIQSVVDPDSVSTSFGYDASGRLSTVTDRRGGATAFAYDAVTWKLATITMPQVPIDAGGGATTLANPVVTYTPWQSVGLPRTSTSSATPASAPLTADVQGVIIDPMNRNTHFNPDRWGQALAQTDAVGRTTTITRWNFLPTSVTHPDGSVDNFAYDTTRALLTMSQPAGSAATYFHYRATTGQVDSVYGAGARTESRRFDANNNVTNIYYFGTRFETDSFTYDATTKRVSLHDDTEAHVERFRYNAIFGNATIDSVAGNRRTVTTFDHHGRDSTITAPASSQVRLTYDALNRVTAQYDGLNATPTTFGHDALFETDITDSNGNNYHTDYNALGWATRQCDPLSACSSARYDKTGLLTSTTNRRGQLVSIGRDQLGRVTSKSGTNTTQVNFSFSANDRDYVEWTSFERDSVFSVPGTATTRARDSVIKRIGPYRFVVAHTAPLNVADTATTTITSNSLATFNPRRVFYSSAGTPDSITAGFGPISFDYSSGGTLHGIHYPGGTFIESRTTALNLPRITGSTTGTLGSSFHRDYHYQPNGDRIDQATNPAVSTQFAYGFDGLGRLTSRDSRSSCTLSSDDFYTGDGSGLGYTCTSSQGTEAFTYDAMGNRTDHSATIGSANRYQSFGGASVAHDADGNVVQRYDPSRFNRQYFWSADGLLTTVMQDSWSTVTYDYNAEGQPVIKHRGDPNGSYVDAYYIWDGDQLFAELDGNGYRRADYVYMPGAIDQPLAQTLGATSPAAMRFHQLDGLGNVIGTFESGTLSQSVTYDSWGYPTMQGNSDNRLLWKGLMFEGDIVSLYYVRNRWYDPEVGRFISEDPVGHDGGFNLYAFSGNDPVDGEDPSGLCDAFVATWIDFVVRGPGQGSFSYPGCTAQRLPDVEIFGSSAIGFPGLRGEGCPAILGCANQSSEAGMRERAAAEALQSPGYLDLVAWLTGGLGGLSSEAATEGSELVLTRTVANHARTRPYLNSTLLAREIMNAAKPIRDPGGMIGALRWDVSGAFNGTEGTWELVIHRSSNRIVHFLFKGIR